MASLFPRVRSPQKLNDTLLLHMLTAVNNFNRLKILGSSNWFLSSSGEKTITAVSNRKAKNMEKKTRRTLLGIQKNNRKSTKRNKQTLLKNVVDYLRADSYLFGPLISPSHSEFAALKFIPSATKGVKIKEPIRGTKKKFIGKVMEYLKSDDYMYASLVYGPLTISGESKLQYIRSFTMDISTRKLTTGENQPTIPSANMTARNQPFKDSIGGMSDPPSNRNSGIGEIVKHMVYQNHCSSSVSGKQMRESQIGEVFIE